MTGKQSYSSYPCPTNKHESIAQEVHIVQAVPDRKI